MQDTNPEAAILVFAKAPHPGTVKTRLAPLLGSDGATALHRQLLRRTLAIARQSAPGALELWCTPDASHPFLQTMAREHNATLHLQRGDDLGARMAHAFAECLQRHSHAICIGIDCPALTVQHLHAADVSLHEGHDVVLVPAEDGGYALIALARPAAEIFVDIDWGGSQVMAQTRERLRANGLRWKELETLWDIDRPEDYVRLLQSGLLNEIPAPA